MNSNSNSDRLAPFADQGCIQPLERRQQIAPRRYRFVSMVARVIANAKQSHESIAEKLVNDPAMLRLDDMHHHPQESIQHPHRFRRRPRGGSPGEGANIDEHDRNRLLDPAQSRIPREDLLRGPASDMKAKRLPQTLLLAQFLQHVIELRDEETELVCAREMHIRIELPLGDT